MATRVILSDLHFGDKLCSLARKEVSEGLRNFLQNLGKIDELILAGDILEGNLSSLTRAIEGDGSGDWHGIGFRKWLEFLYEKGLDAKKIVYIPGNHDYKIWDILAANESFVSTLASGKTFKGGPLMAWTFEKPFIKGVVPTQVSEFKVSYPDHEFSVNGRSVLVTHGHYLEPTQSLFISLEDMIKDAGGDTKKAVRGFYIRTAQYQAMASAVSYRKGTRGFIDKIYRFLSGLEYIWRLRNAPIDKKQLKAIDYYLCYFSEKEPDVFIYGHTHKPGRVGPQKLGGNLLQKDVDVFNSGSFMEDGDKAGSFIVCSDSAPQPICLYTSDINGVIKKM